MSRRAAVAIAIALTAPCSCKTTAPPDVPDASESPQAKAEPAPLTNVMPTSSATPFGADAGPPAVPLRADAPVPPDPIGKDLPTWEMSAALRPFDPPPAFRGKETTIDAIDAAKKKTEARLAIDFGAARARIVLNSAGFVLPEGTELRARADRYGHFVLLPGAQQYRVAAPGSLRALFDDRRLDVAPLPPADITPKGDGARRLGYRTRRLEVTNRVGTATFDVARVPEAGEGGALVCRALLDLMNAPPSTPVCGLDDVPLHVEWRWPNKQGIVFDAYDLERRLDVPATALAAPPPATSFAMPALPALGAEALVPPIELAAFRSAPADVAPPAVPDGAPPPPPSGLALGNQTDQLRFAWLDGAPVAWVGPGGRLALPSLLRGRYGFAWRTFLADAIDPPITITVPTGEVAGALDAGAP